MDNAKTRRRLLAGVGSGGLATTMAALAGCVPGGGAPDSAPQSQQGGELTWLIADQNQETQGWFADTLIPAFQKERPQAQVT
ncbi:MAG: hypothetical protein ACRDI2_18860, partial [Chloroflexota bacterium]